MPEAAVAVSTPNETLVGLARSGDRPALEELFRRHWGVAYRAADRRLANEQDALDAVQEGLMKGVAHLKDFDGRSGFRTWLLRIVTNVAIDAGRRRTRRRNLALEVNNGLPAGSEPATEDDPARD